MTNETPRRLTAEAVESYVGQLYRLFSICTLHMPNNDAIANLVEVTVVKFREMPELGIQQLSFFFHDDAVYANGQLLKAERATYESAIELLHFLQRVDANEVQITADVSRENLRKLATAFIARWRPEDLQVDDEILAGNFPGAVLRKIDPASIDAICGYEHDPFDQLKQAYASAVVIMRLVNEGFLDGKFIQTRSLRRLMQQLVRHAQSLPQAFRVIATMPTSMNDAGTRAVRRALIAIATCLPLCGNPTVVANTALSALFFDCGKAHAAGMGSLEKGALRVIPRLTEEQNATLYRTSPFAMLASAGLHSDALIRAQVVRDTHLLMHGGGSSRSSRELSARILFLAHMFTEYLRFDVSSQSRRTTSEVIELLREHSEPELITLVGVLARALGVEQRTEASKELRAELVGTKSSNPLDKAAEASTVDVLPSELDSRAGLESVVSSADETEGKALAPQLQSENKVVQSSHNSLDEPRGIGASSEAPSLPELPLLEEGLLGSTSGQLLAGDSLNDALREQAEAEGKQHFSLPDTPSEELPFKDEFSEFRDLSRTPKQNRGGLNVSNSEREAPVPPVFAAEYRGETNTLQSLDDSRFGQSHLGFDPNDSRFVEDMPAAADLLSSMGAGSVSQTKREAQPSPPRSQGEENPTSTSLSGQREEVASPRVNDSPSSFAPESFDGLRDTLDRGFDDLELFAAEAPQVNESEELQSLFDDFELREQPRAFTETAQGQLGKSERTRGQDLSQQTAGRRDLNPMNARASEQPTPMSRVPTKPNQPSPLPSPPVQGAKKKICKHF